MQSDILNTEVTTIDGEKTTLEGYKGNVLLIVNVASKCGLTPQYEQLENIQKAWEKDGFTVLGFPCNQFLGQEPGSEEEIKTFCSTTYGVTFPLFSKIDVNGEGPPSAVCEADRCRSRKPLRRKAAVFMNAWPAKAARRFTRTISCGISKNSSSTNRVR